MAEEKKKKPKNKPLKRFNGQGTVYKLSGRRRKPWVAAVTVGRSKLEGNKVIQEREILGYFEKESEAETALLMHNAGLSPQKSTMTLGQVYESWSKVKFAEDISKSTKDGIKAAWKRFSKMENSVFCELRSDHFQEAINEARDIEKVSESTLTKMKSLVYTLCEYAYQNSIIPKNFSSLIKIGKVETNEREPFNDLEVEIFRKNIYKVPWADTILVLCYTGMRVSEMLMLTKFNVDMENKVITGGIKTDAGKNRIVPIHPLIYPIFIKWFNKNGDTIFCDEKGKSLSARTYREKKFAPALETMGVRPLTPHSCRHTFATMLNRVEAQPANIQKLIGHVVGSDTTDKVYTHPEIEDLRKTIEMLK
jgi:integrase